MSSLVSHPKIRPKIASWYSCLHGESEWLPHRAIGSLCGSTQSVWLGQTILRECIIVESFHRIRDVFWRILALRRIPPKLVNVTNGLHSGTESAVRHDDTISDYYPSDFGVRRGCVLAQTLFNICIDDDRREGEGRGGEEQSGSRSLTLRTTRLYILCGRRGTHETATVSWVHAESLESLSKET